MSGNDRPNMANRSYLQAVQYQINPRIFDPRSSTAVENEGRANMADRAYQSEQYQVNPKISVPGSSTAVENEGNVADTKTRNSDSFYSDEYNLDNDIEIIQKHLSELFVHLRHIFNLMQSPLTTCYWNKICFSQDLPHDIKDFIRKEWDQFSNLKDLSKENLENLSREIVQIKQRNNQLLQAYKDISTRLDEDIEKTRHISTIDRKDNDAYIKFSFPKRMEEWINKNKSEYELMLKNVSGQLKSQMSTIEKGKGKESRTISVIVISELKSNGNSDPMVTIFLDKLKEEFQKKNIECIFQLQEKASDKSSQNLADCYLILVRPARLYYGLLERKEVKDVVQAFGDITCVVVFHQHDGHDFRSTSNEKVLPNLFKYVTDLYFSLEGKLRNKSQRQKIDPNAASLKFLYTWMQKQSNPTNI